MVPGSTKAVSRFHVHRENIFHSERCGHKAQYLAICASSNLVSHIKSVPGEVSDYAVASTI